MQRSRRAGAADHRSLRGAAWDSIGLVQKKLRPEDADAWSAWAARRATDQLFQQLPVEVPEGDRSRIAELLGAHYREEARRLIDARPGWEDRSRAQADREGAYAEWLREFRRSAEERDKRKQAAPGLRVTGKAFGPGRRFPIVQRYRP